MEDNTITKENYRTNHNFLSFTRVSKFLECEAAAAVNFREPASTALLVGSYVDAYFSNELDEFKEEHPEIFNSKTGNLKADFLSANKIIERIESDELFMKFMSGEKQKIMTGEIDGTKFKIKIDSYIPDKCIVDLKVMKDFKPVYSTNFRSYVSLVQAYNYDIELALFQEIVYQNTGKKLPCYIAAITKEEPSNIGIFNIPQKDLDHALQILKNNLPRIKQIINGEIEPNRCETCYYCRMTKKSRVLNWELIGADGDSLREIGIECNDPKVTKNNKED